MKFVRKWLWSAALLPAVAVAQTADIPSASDRCPESYARTCYGYDGRYCIAIFYLRGDEEFADKTVQAILDNIAKQAQARRPSKIEITSHFMDGSEHESKKLAKVRARNVRSALIERGNSSKIIKVKSPIQRCVVSDDEVTQRRVEVVFVPEKKRK